MFPQSVEDGTMTHMKNANSVGQRMETSHNSRTAPIMIDQELEQAMEFEKIVFHQAKF